MLAAELKTRAKAAARDKSVPGGLKVAGAAGAATKAPSVTPRQGSQTPETTRLPLKGVTGLTPAGPSRAAKDARPPKAPVVPSSELTPLASSNGSTTAKPSSSRTTQAAGDGASDQRTTSKSLDTKADMASSPASTKRPSRKSAANTAVAATPPSANEANTVEPVAVAEPPVKTKPEKPAAVIAPKPVKLVKAPALNFDDPFEGIDELSEGQFLYQQRELLFHERGVYAEQARMLRAEADQIAADMEPGDVQFDDESGEGAGVTIERERDLAMSAQASLTVDEIDRALVRVGNGVYGYCEHCHELIMRARLRAMPSATLCIRCKNGGLSRR